MNQQKKDAINNGKVYAIKTNHGYAVIQECEEHLFRVFSIIYATLPIDLAKLLHKAESYICSIKDFKECSSIIYLATMPIPKTFKVPRYTRCSASFKGDDAPIQFWSIYDRNTKTQISIKDYIEKHLRIKCYDLAWKKCFLSLSPSGAFFVQELILMLEKLFSLENWKPLNFEEDTDLIDQLFSNKS